MQLEKKEGQIHTTITIRINLLFYLYFPPSSHLIYVYTYMCIHILDGTTVENKGKTIN